MEFTGERYIPEKVSGQIETEHFQRYLSIKDLVKDKVVLDAACGAGYGTNLLGQKAEKVYGIDISVEAVNYAKEHYGRSNVEFIVSSIDNLHFPNEYFDMVVSYETIEHVDESIQNLFLKEVKRVLKKDGLFIISTPNKKLYSDLNEYKNQYHIKEFYEDEFLFFIEKEFKFIKNYQQYYANASILINTEESKVTPFSFDESRKGIYIISLASNAPEKLNVNLSSICYSRELNQEVEKPELMIFLDTGKGYNSEEHVSTKSKYDKDTDCFIAYYSIGSSDDSRDQIRTIRFDPIEGQPCKVKIVRVTSDGIISEVIPLNANDTIEGWDLFLNIDSMYEITGKFDKSTFLEIHFKIEYIKFEEAIQLLYSENLQLPQYEAVLAQTQRQLEQTQGQLEKTQGRLGQTQGQLEQTQEQLEQTQGQLEKTQGQLGQTQGQLEQTQGQFEQAAHELMSIRSQLDQVLSQLSVIENSQCWKMTKPLRKILDIIKGV